MYSGPRDLARVLYGNLAGKREAETGRGSQILRKGVYIELNFILSLNFYSFILRESLSLAIIFFCVSFLIWSSPISNTSVV